MKHRLGFEIGRTSRLIRRHLDSSATKIYTDKLTGTHGRAIGFFRHNSDRDIFSEGFRAGIQYTPLDSKLYAVPYGKNGLIKRESVPYDARLKKIVLTDKAIEIQNYVDSNLDSFEKNISEGISDSELEIFISVLDKINKNLERMK